jgi:hypothetical protein
VRLRERNSLIQKEHTCGSFEFVVLAHVHLQQQVPKNSGARLGALPPFSALVNGFIKHYTEHLYKLKACSIHMIKLKDVILFF